LAVDDDLVGLAGEAVRADPHQHEQVPEADVIDDGLLGVDALHIAADVARDRCVDGRLHALPRRSEAIFEPGAIDLDGKAGQHLVGRRAQPRQIPLVENARQVRCDRR